MRGERNGIVQVIFPQGTHDRMVTEPLQVAVARGFDHISGPLQLHHPALFVIGSVFIGHSCHVVEGVIACHRHQGSEVNGGAQWHFFRHFIED